MSMCVCGDVAQYKCPRCERPYCSLGCYKAPAHAYCSETFYREQVEEELKQMKPEKEHREQMMAMLRREQEQNKNEEEGVSELLENVKLKSETELWELLTGEEQKAFLKGIETGSISVLLKPKVLWWQEDNVVYKPTKTKPLTELTSKEPSPLLKYSVLQVLLAYVQVEMIHQSPADYLDYWGHVTTLWDSESSTVFHSADAACIEFTQRAGAQKYVAVEDVISNTVELLKRGHLAAERACCSLSTSLTKVHKNHQVPKMEYTSTKRKLQFYASWCTSQHGLLHTPDLVTELTLHVQKLGNARKEFAREDCKESRGNTGVLIEEILT